jgi:hypothetical protein
MSHLLKDLPKNTATPVPEMAYRAMSNAYA